jgi:hypothetical protein
MAATRCGPMYQRSSSLNREFPQTSARYCGRSRIGSELMATQEVVNSRDLVLGGRASCGSTTGNVRTKRWVMRRRRTCILIPAPTGPCRPNGKRCSLRETGAIATLDREAGGIKRLEIRPPAAVGLGTLRKRRGRTGSAPHGSFSLFERVLKRGVNDRQAKIEVTASRKNRASFQRSVVKRMGSTCLF